MEIYSLSFFLLVSVGLILYYTVFSRCQWICLLGLSLLFYRQRLEGPCFSAFHCVDDLARRLAAGKAGCRFAARRKAPGISKDEKAIKAQAVRRKNVLLLLC